MNTKIIVIVAVTILAVAGVGAGIALLTKDSGGEYTVDTELQIFGNANGDWKLNSDDVTYLREIISGEKEESTYADANQDGVIDENDVTQVEAVIDRTAGHIWLVDGDSHVKKISPDISRIGAEYYSNTELMCILQLQDKVVAVDNAPYQTREFYFGEERAAQITNLVNMNAPNYEFVAGLDLDILLTFSYAGTEAKQEVLEDVDVIYLGMYRPDVLEPERSEYIQGILKAGYIFDRVERAEAYVEWLLDVRDDISLTSRGIAEEDKVNVLMTDYSNSYFIDETVTDWSICTKIDLQV
jgi:iron complex transport system substrate-binding protein